MDDSDLAPEPLVAPLEDVAAKIDLEAGPKSARSSFLKSSWNGARIGFRLSNLIILPISLLLMIVCLIPTAFGLGAGRGFGVHPLAFNVVAMYLVFVILVAIFGSIIALIAALTRWARGRSGTSTWRAKANRPIRLFRKRETVSTSVESVTAAPRIRTRWRLRRWAIGTLAFLFVVVFAAAFGTGIYAGRIVDRRLAAALADASRDDPNWRLDDLMAAREIVPDKENSAIVVARVVAMLPKHWPGLPANFPGRLDPPPSEVMLAFDEMEATESNVRLDDDTAAKLRDELHRLNDAVQLARTVANYARGRHELDLQPSLMATLLRETQDSREAARFLAVDAAIQAHDGQIDGALDSCRAILSVGRSIGDEPFLISGLVRIAIGGVAMKSARRVLAQGEPSDEVLARFQALVQNELSQPLLLQGVKGERGMMDEIIRRIADSELPISSLNNNPRPGELVPRVSPWGKVAFDNQRAIGLQWMNDLVFAARQPVCKQPPLLKAWEAEINRVWLSRLGPYTATIPVLMMPAITTCAQAHDRYQAELGSMTILLASERHRRKTGDWPVSIAAIDPGILAKAPLDPFSGQPFLLERSDGQFLIHSIGANLKDDHGVSLPKLWMKGGPDDVGTGAWDVSLRKQPADQ